MAEQARLDLQAESTAYSYKRYVGLYEAYRAEGQHSEDLLLRFLVKQSEGMVASSLWTVFSHIKKYLLLECSLDIGRAPRITEYLKTLSKFHKKRKAPSFTREEVFDYLRRATNVGKDLLNKVVLLAGFYGGMRCCELAALLWEDVAFAAEGVLIKIRFSKTDRAGVGATKLLPALEDDAISAAFYFSLYRDAVADKTERLFRNFAVGKFTRAPIGKNIISGMPRSIAQFLDLSNPESYTGHSFRVSSATVLADEGATSITLKRHGRWTSDSVAEGYLRESKQARKETAALLSGSTSLLASNQNSGNSNANTTNAIVFNNCAFSGPVYFCDAPK